MATAATYLSMRGRWRVAAEFILSADLRFKPPTTLCAFATLVLTTGHRRNRLWSVWRRFLASIMASALVVGVAVGFMNSDRGADAVALHEVNSVQPQAHWSIVRRSFELWASVVSRGSYRMTGGSGPAWVLELSAPGDSKFNNYSAVVVVSAVSGSMSATSVLATS